VTTAADLNGDCASAPRFARGSPASTPCDEVCPQAQSFTPGTMSTRRRCGETAP